MFLATTATSARPVLGVTLAEPATTTIGRSCTTATTVVCSILGISGTSTTPTRGSVIRISAHSLEVYFDMSMNFWASLL